MFAIESKPLNPEQAKALIGTLQAATILGAEAAAVLQTLIALERIATGVDTVVEVAVPE